MTMISRGTMRSLRLDARAVVARVGNGIDEFDGLAMIAGLAALRDLRIESDWVSGAGSYLIAYSYDDADNDTLRVYVRDGKLVIEE